MSLGTYSSRRLRCRLPHRATVLWPIAAACLMLTALAAQSVKPTEFQVKAVYLYNFGKFVKWPDPIMSGNDTFSICVLGVDPFGNMLDSTVSGEALEGKKVVVRRITGANETHGCRIVFVALSEQARLAGIMTTIGKAPILTVSDIPGFSDHYGMIEFVMDHGRVRFIVNLPVAEKAGLSLSSELLKVATLVKREGTSGE